MERNFSDSFKKKIVDWRRHLHRFPELSGEERETSAFIAAQLEKLGVKVTRFQKHHGLLGEIKGALAGGITALRADMDALPVREETGLPFASERPGVMHACGHDAHMAILLGTAAVLMQRQDKIKGTVKLIFQPSEEASPTGGARLMLAEGILDDVERIFGLHVWPQLAAGEVGIRSGYFLASSDRFTITLRGQSAHAAQPQQGVDAIVMAAEAVQGIYLMTARQIDPLETATLSIGTIRGGERYNVMPSEAVLEGTVRTLGERTRREIPRKIERLLQGIACAYGGAYDLQYRQGYAAVKNAALETAVVVRAAQEALGEGHVFSEIAPSMIAEDFAYYQQKIPGAFFFLGCRGENGAGLHNSRLTLDENALFAGIRVFTSILENA